MDEPEQTQKLGTELLGHRRTDGAPIFRALHRKASESLLAEGYEYRTWPSQPTTIDRWPSIRGWALPE